MGGGVWKQEKNKNVMQNSFINWLQNNNNNYYYITTLFQSTQFPLQTLAVVIAIGEETKKVICEKICDILILISFNCKDLHTCLCWYDTHVNKIHSHEVWEIARNFTKQRVKNECETHPCLHVSEPQTQNEPAPELGVSHLEVHKPVFTIK
jgi:hypothetical protein